MALKLALKRTGQKQYNEFLASELIGKELSVVESTCKDFAKASGRIVDETTNTFVIDIRGTSTVRKRIRIPKNCCVFQINNTKVDGSTLVGRPEDRTKKFLR